MQAIAQTSDGYLWIGTQDGLFRFDGVRFVKFDRHNTKALPSHDVLVLRESRDKRLWIGTDRGLAVHQNGLFGVVELPGTSSDFVVRALCEDKSGRL